MSHNYKNEKVTTTATEKATIISVLTFKTCMFLKGAADTSSLGDQSVQLSAWHFWPRTEVKFSLTESHWNFCREYWPNKLMREKIYIYCLHDNFEAILACLLGMLHYQLMQQFLSQGWSTCTKKRQKMSKTWVKGSDI